MVWAHKTSLTAPIFIEVHVSIQGYKWPCICVFMDIDFAHSTIFLFHFGNVVFLFFFTISLYSVELIGLLYIADYRKILNCFSYRS